MSGDAFTDAIAHAMLGHAPDVALALGVDSVGGRALDPESLPDFSPRGEAERAACVSVWAKTLRANSQSRSSGDWLARAALQFVVERGGQHRFLGEAGRGLEHHLDPITHVSGVHATLTDMLVRDANVKSRSDATHFVGRLARCAIAIDGTIESLRVRAARKAYADPDVLGRVIADLEAIGGPAGAHSFLRPLRNVDEPMLESRARALMESEVVPAYGRLLDELRGHRRAALQAPERQKREGFEAFYKWRLETHVTTAIDPREAHTFALEEAARLKDLIGERLKKEGVSEDPKAGFAALAARAPLRGEQLEAYAREVLETARAKLRPLFGLWPKAACEVRALDKAQQGSVHHHYVPASPAHGRQAIFWINPALAAEQSVAELEVLCFHEVWPGHHLQLAIAQERGLGALRSIFLFNAYLEGWAKYAEALPLEAGMGSAAVELASLRTELYSTATLAFDTGIFAMNWTREEALQFFMEATGASREFAQSALLRALANPGHLCAYKLGLVRMRALRRAYFARAPKATLVDFHNAVLREGVLPLHVLERHVLGANEEV